MMIQGILFFDAESGRYNFYYDNGQGEQCDYEGIHCGECFEVNLNGVWVPTRVEMGCDRKWYLVGLPGVKLDGLEVRQL